MKRRPPPGVILVRRIMGIAILATLVATVLWLFSLAVFYISHLGDSSVKTRATDCAPGVVSIEAFAGDGENRQSDFDLQTNPELWFTVTNTGKVACTFNAGPKAQIYTIKFGQDVIWTNEQCDRTGVRDDVITLTPGKAEKAKPSPWLKVYSSEEGCGKGQPAAYPGIYSFSVKVNNVSSINTENFTLQ